jgi:hypothetical protein
LITVDVVFPTSGLEHSLSVNPRSLALIALSLRFKQAFLEPNAAAFALRETALSRKRAALRLIATSLRFKLHASSSMPRPLS